jgi:DNA-directed RNA polymerase, mitochondrial
MIERLSAHISDRLRDLKAFRRPERRVAKVLRSRNPDDLAKIIISVVADCVGKEADWYETTETLAEELDLDGPDRIEKIRAGNLALNLCVEALPDLFTLDDQDAPQAVAELPRHPSHLEPCTDLPRPWSGSYDDGYGRFVAGGRPENRAAVAEAFVTGAIAPHAAAVSALQAVPFAVNTRVLDAVKWLYELGGDVKVKGIPPKIIPTSTNAWAQGRINARHRSLQVRFERDLETAERMVEDFYTPMHCDWRGRIYGIPDFKFEREDRVRALFLFADPKPIGERGLYWLKVHVANCGDFDGISKRTFDERVQWCDERPYIIRMIARFPRDRRGQMWLEKADHPFAFLAACIELAAAWDVGPEYETRLPILFDASSSGLQHYCAMTRSKDAWRVNLGDRSPQDIYQAVANEVRRRAKHDAMHATSNRQVRALSDREDDFDDIPDEGFAKAKSAEALLETRITRKLVKANVMTKVYGASDHGRADQNFEKLKKQHWVQDRMAALKKAMGERERVAQQLAIGELGEQSWYLAELIKQELQKLVPAAHEAMNFLTELAETLQKENKPLRWTTPSGFPWLNCYREHDIKRERFLIGGKVRQKKIAVGYKDNLRRRKTKDSAAPNFIHACDASHLALTINATGISDLVAVHDCLGCHAPMADHLRETILRTLVEMYSKHGVLAEVLASAQAVTNAKLPPLPPAGPFDLRETLRADYAFQ